MGAKKRGGVKFDPFEGIDRGNQQDPNEVKEKEDLRESKSARKTVGKKKPYGVPLSDAELEELRDWSIQIDKPVSHIIQDAVSEKLKALRSEHGEVRPRKRNPRVGRPFSN